MRLRRRDEYGDVPRRRLARWHQLLMCLCDLLGVGWEQHKTGLVVLRGLMKPSKGSVLDRIDQLEARVAELEAEGDEGRRAD